MTSLSRREWLPTMTNDPRESSTVSLGTSPGEGRQLRKFVPWFALGCVGLVGVFLVVLPPRPSIEVLQRSVVLVEVFDKKSHKVGQGSGVIIGKDQVLTNIHVIEGGAEVRVTDAGSSVTMDIDGILSYDATNDLVVLVVPTVHNPPPIGLSSKSKVGERVTAVGNPLGLTGSVSEGIISGFREIDGRHLIQMTTPISPGSSGGALFNSRGKLIGITVAHLQGGQNLNLAVPIEIATALLGNDGQFVTYLDSDFSKIYPTDRENDGLIGPVASVGERRIDSMGGSWRKTEYDSKGRRVSEVEMNSLGTRTTTFEHDRYKRAVSSISVGPFDQNPSRNAFLYDAAGHMIELIMSAGYKESYSYNSYGQLQRRESSLFKGKDIKWYTYAPDGTLLSERWDFLSSISEYSGYRYDRAGNWVERAITTYEISPSGTRKSNPISTSKEVREIIYF